jgi:hypothetical protein
MGFYLPLSCTPEFKKRCAEHFAPGLLSRWLVDLAEKEMDRLDGIEALRKHHQMWIDTTVKPFIIQYCGKGQLYPLIGDEQLFFELHEAGINVSEPDIKLCIEMMIMELEK